MNESPQNEKAASLPGPAANEDHASTIPLETATGNAPAIKSEHPYTDRNGETLFRAVVLADGRRHYQRRDTLGDWADGLAGVMVLPYDWPNWHDQTTVNLCRDEAEADLLLLSTTTGQHATALPDGRWSSALASYFMGKTVILWRARELSVSDEARRGLAAAGAKVKMAIVPDPYPTLATWLARRDLKHEAVEGVITEATDLPPPGAPPRHGMARHAERPVFTTDQPPTLAPEPWGEALPMAAAGEVDPFPVEHLPAVLQAQAQAVNETIGVPVEVPAMLALVVAGTAMGNKFRVEIKPGHWQFGNLFVLIPAPPGSGKTPTFGPMTVPLRQWEDEQLAGHGRRLAEWKSRAKQLEAQLAGLEKKMEKGLRHE